MAFRLIRILAVAAIVVMGLMAHGPSEAFAHEELADAHDTGPSTAPALRDGAALPDEPVPSEVPQPEASVEPVPSEPAPSASVEPVPTEVPQPEASAEPAPSEPVLTASVEPTPTEVPQPEASAAPVPTAAPSTGAIIAPTPEATASDQQPPPRLSVDRPLDPEPRAGPETTRADNAAAVASRTHTPGAAELQPPAPAPMSPSSINPAQPTANTRDAGPATESGVGSVTVSSRWTSVDVREVTGAIPDLVLEGIEPVSAGVVVGVAVTNRAPAVAVAMEFGRAGSGWAGAILFNLWLRRQLRERRMSQRRLAGLSGVNHSTISRLLQYDRHPTLETATKLAMALRKSGGELDTTAYFDRLPEETLFPARRVEMALRGDDLLDESDVQRLMRSYLRARQSRSGVPARLVADGSRPSDAERRR